MIKVKKSLALLVTVFLILSNVAFAPPSPYSDSSAPSYYEGKPIDDSREGVDYYREGQVIVYPAKISSNEKKMMERFARGEISENEMRAIAKAKSGNRFSEMEFQKGVLEFKERMDRKEAFSYENEGYEPRYYVSPSYEGYSKEHMIFGMIFEHIGDDIDPREIKQYCNEPEKVADIVIQKFKEKVGDLQKVCKRMEEEETKCADIAKKSCYQLGIPFVREDATEIEKLQSIAYSCPVNQDAIIQACKRRSIFHMEQRIKNADEECKKRFDFEGERLLKECERFRDNTICDKEKFMERCMGGIKKDDFEEKREGFMHAKWECYDGSTESHTDSSCKSSEAWQELARKSCEDRCNADKSKCGVNSFGVSGECKPKTKICPAYPVPTCGEGTVLKTKIDANGCVYYNCEKSTTEPCPLDAKQCPDGSYVARIGPNCEFKPCPTTTACPAVSIPMCASGTTLQKKIDSNGCVYYHCTIPTCPTVEKPTCGADETVQGYYDNIGCVTSYQCIKHISCPEVSKPTCSEGQSLTTKYDDKGCITGYECLAISKYCGSGTTTSDCYCNKDEIKVEYYLQCPEGLGCPAVMHYKCDSLSAPTSNVIRITGNTVLEKYEDLLRHCENSWMEQQRMCSNIPNVCDRETFIEKCKEQEKKSYADFTSRIEQNCESQTIAEIKHAEQRCSRIDEDRKRCSDENTKRCEHMKGIAQQCIDLLTEENLRNFIVEEVKKRCKFTDIIQDEDDVRKAEKVEIILAVLNTATEEDIKKLELFVDNLKEELKLEDTTIYKGTIDPNRFGDIKLLPFVVNAKISTVVSSERAKEVKAKIVARQKVEEAASKLVSLRDSDVPNEYLYIIEDQASDVLDVSGKLGEIEKKEEQKGIGYKIRLFLGLAKKAEQEEVKQLIESKEKLKNSVETLTKLVDEVPSDVAKAILKEQVENLNSQKLDIEILIETKEKKAKGLLGLFG